MKIWIIQHFIVLIESKWNVNSKAKSKRITQNLVLIESKWNVNDHYNLVAKFDHWVLIESKWNVNLTRIFSFLPAYVF